jgi:hypothetical protein
MRLRQERPLGTPGRAGVWTRLRFNPRVLVFLATSLVVFYLVREAVPSFIFWYYGSTYRQVDFVMDRAQDNDGWPIVRGPLDPGGEEWVLELRATPSGYVLESDPAIAFAPGRRVRVWWSDAAPVVGFGKGRSTKIMPVSTFPRIPGAWRLLAWLAAVLVVGLAGLRVAGLRVFRTRVRETETLFDEAPKPDP